MNTTDLYLFSRQDVLEGRCHSGVGEERWRARAYIAAALALTLVRISLLVKISYNQRNLETALAEKDKGKVL